MEGAIRYSLSPHTFREVVEKALVLLWAYHQGSILLSERMSSTFLLIYNQESRKDVKPTEIPKPWAVERRVLNDKRENFIVL